MRGWVRRCAPVDSFVEAVWRERQGRRMGDSKKSSAAEAAVAAHYGLLLGIQSPWFVQQVDLQLEGQSVEVKLGYDSAMAVSCPHCQRACGGYDHAPERQWRHLDVMQFTTVIRARVPRCQCPTHGVVTA